MKRVYSQLRPTKCQDGESEWKNLAARLIAY